MVYNLSLSLLYCVIGVGGDVSSSQGSSYFMSQDRTLKGDSDVEIGDFDDDIVW